MDTPYLFSTQKALEHFQVNEQQGLSEQQVQTSLEKYGRNGTVHHHISLQMTVLILPLQLYQKTLQCHYGSLFLNNLRTSSL